MIKKTKSNLTDTRDSFKPFNYPWAYEAWLKHEQSHWMHTECPMVEDVKDWKKKLNAEEKQIIYHRIIAEKPLKLKEIADFIK
jgi:ribonucleoside-diphosphate reductase beta chain